jgi:hypothetical protein
MYYFCFRKSIVKAKRKMKRQYLFIAGQNRKFLFLVCAALYVANIPAQVHIGSESPPDNSAMLEISAVDKGVLLPSVALSALNDRTVMVNNQAADGLLVYNTTENASLNLYKGFYAWNSVKNLWENIVSEQSFQHMLALHYATEETYFVANVRQAQSQSIISDRTETLTFSPADISINKDNCFDAAGNAFVVPKDGYYKVICGMEIQNGWIDANDKADIRLVFAYPSGRKETNTLTATRANIRTVTTANLDNPLTPSLIHNGFFEKGVRITVEGSMHSKNGYTGEVNRKYLYVNMF